MKLEAVKQSLSQFFQGFRTKWVEILPKVMEIAKKILIGLAGAALFATNPTVFCLGLVTGIIWEKKVQEVVNKVVQIWKRQTLFSSMVIAAGAILSIHITWAAASLLYSSHLGSHLADPEARGADFSLF